MREVKYRAFIKSLGYMVPVLLIDFQTNEVQAELPNGHGDVWEYRFDEVELMQWTGLADKDGREIYEGDIVEFKTMSRVERHYVEYSEYGEWCVGMHRLSMRFQTCEVIGNIYENPELLEVAG